MSSTVEYTPPFGTLYPRPACSSAGRSVLTWPSRPLECPRESRGLQGVADHEGAAGHPQRLEDLRLNLLHERLADGPLQREPQNAEPDVRIGVLRPGRRPVAGGGNGLEDPPRPALDRSGRRAGQARLTRETGGVTGHLPQRRIGPFRALLELRDLRNQRRQGSLQRDRADVGQDRHEHRCDGLGDGAGTVDGLPGGGHPGLGIRPSVGPRPEHFAVLGQRHGDRAHPVGFHVRGNPFPEGLERRKPFVGQPRDVRGGAGGERQQQQQGLHRHGSCHPPPDPHISSRNRPPRPPGFSGGSRHPIDGVRAHRGILQE